MNPTTPNQIPDNELMDLILNHLRHKQRTDNKTHLRVIVQELLSMVQSRNYAITHVPYRAIEMLWRMTLNGILTPFGYHTGYEAADQWVLSVTDYGQNYLSQDNYCSYDSDGYARMLRKASAVLDPIVEQYACESLKCLRQNLCFAAAVMIGAAAEKAVLILFESIIESASDPNTQTRLQRAMSGTAKLPTIYDTIKNAVGKQRQAIEHFDPKTNESAMIHILSLFDMIRRQRNDAVHPTNGTADPNAVLLAINSFPIALEIVYKFQAFFVANKGALLI